MDIYAPGVSIVGASFSDDTSTLGVYFVIRMYFCSFIVNSFIGNQHGHSSRFWCSGSVFDC